MLAFVHAAGVAARWRDRWIILTHLTHALAFVLSAASKPTFGMKPTGFGNADTAIGQAYILIRNLKLNGDMNMKHIENLGGWVLNSKIGAIFGVLVLLAGLGITLSGPKTVTMSESEFACVDTEPFGISARCTAYRRVR